MVERSMEMIVAIQIIYVITEIVTEVENVLIKASPTGAMRTNS
jgi:hypothetical protein